MKLILSALLFCVLILNSLLLSVDIKAAESGSPFELEVVYSGDLNGELEPCGCSAKGDFGGIRRRATLVEQLKKKNDQLVLLSSGGLFGGHWASERLINEFILKGMQLIGYDAIGLQWRDLSYGSEIIENSQLPFVASNDQQSNVARTKVLKKQDKTIAFYALLDKMPVTKDNKQFTRQQEKQIERLQAQFATRHKAGQLVFLSTNQSYQQIKQKISLQHVDLLMIKARYEDYAEPQLIDRTLILQPGSRGLYLGDVKLWFDENNRISNFSHEILPMPDSMADSPRLEDWYQQYTAAIKADYLLQSEIASKNITGESSFTTQKQCKSCHLGAYQIWQASRHASAFESLKEVNKTFDPNCLVCHTLAMGQIGGFIDRTTTPDHLNVQCESCHGAGSAHAASGGSVSIGVPLSQHTTADLESSKNGSQAKNSCVSCHSKENSPDFQLEHYWKIIAH